MPSTSRVALFVAKNGRGDPSDAFGIGDRVDLDDLALSDGETHYGEGPSTTVMTTPAAPFTSAGCRWAAGMARACPATAAAPRITWEAAGRAAGGEWRSTATSVPPSSPSQGHRPREAEAERTNATCALGPVRCRRT